MLCNTVPSWIPSVSRLERLALGRYPFSIHDAYLWVGSIVANMGDGAEGGSGGGGGDFFLMVGPTGGSAASSGGERKSMADGSNGRCRRWSVGVSTRVEVELDDVLGPLTTTAPPLLPTLCAFPTSIGFRSGTGFRLPLPSLPLLPGVFEEEDV